GAGRLAGGSRSRATWWGKHRGPHPPDRSLDGESRARGTPDPRGRPSFGAARGGRPRPRGAAERLPADRRGTARAPRPVPPGEDLALAILDELIQPADQPAAATTWSTSNPSKTGCAIVRERPWPASRWAARKASERVQASKAAREAQRLWEA